MAQPFDGARFGSKQRLITVYPMRNDMIEDDDPTIEPPTPTEEGWIILDGNANKTILKYNKVTSPEFVGKLTGTADKAEKDGNGNDITQTYATKAEINNFNNTYATHEDVNSATSTVEMNLSAYVDQYFAQKTNSAGGAVVYGIVSGDTLTIYM